MSDDIKPSVGIRLGGPDRTSIKYLSSWLDGLPISPLVNNRDERLHQFLIDTNFANGSSLFRGESDVDIGEFRKLTNNDLADVSNADIQQIFIYWFMRVRNYTHILSLLQAEIRKARVGSFGSNYASTCSKHTDSLINVVDAVSWVKWFNTLTQEDYIDRVFGKDFGFPPYNVECLCNLEGIIPGVDYN